jgi:predicted  nucleic acid-binding Zn-ribbon protein
MIDKTDDKGKGTQGPGEAPRRPYATIDLKATEIGGDRASAAPPPGAESRSNFAKRLRVARRMGAAALGNNSFLSQVTAGVAGAVLTLVVGALFGLFAGGSPGSSQAVPTDLSRRLAALEQKMAQPGDIAGQLAKSEVRLKALEERTASVPALTEGQARLAAQAKALESRSGSPELVSRMAKLETSVAALAAGNKGSAGANAEALTARLADIEKQAADASEAVKAASQRIDRDVASFKSEAARLGERLDVLKSEMEERFKDTAKSGEIAPVLNKLAAFERELQGFLRGEGERSANSTRVLLTLEMANLKRAMDRGDRYTAELEAVKKVAGGTVKLAALERYKLDGVRTLPELTKDFRGVANAAMDAEAEHSDASVLDRLISGAKGIVRVRKMGHADDDKSVEAITGRMEAALKEGRLGEVIAQGKTLPPRAAQATEPWLKKVEARHAVDQAMAELEAGLKSSLSAPAEPRK